MRFILSLIVLFFYASPSYAETITVAIAGTEIKIETPPSSCAYDTNYEIDKTALEWLKQSQSQAGNILLHAWSDCDSLKAVRNRHSKTMDSWGHVVATMTGNPKSVRRFDGLSRLEFLKQATKALSGKKLSELMKNLDDTANKAAEKANEKYLGSKDALTISGAPLSLGILDVDDAIYSGIIINVKSEAKDKEAIAGIFSSTLVKGLILNVNVYKPYKDGDTIKSLLKDAKSAVRKITNLNN